MIFLTVSQTLSWCKGDRVGWQACVHVSVYGCDLAKWCLWYIYSANEETDIYIAVDLPHSKSPDIKHSR